MEARCGLSRRLVDDLTVRIGNDDARAGGVGRQGIAERRLPVDQGALVVRVLDGMADERQSRDRLVRRLQRYEIGQLAVGVDRLLNLAERDELAGELIGIERRERVLILELRRQQGQESLEIAAQPGNRRR